MREFDKHLAELDLLRQPIERVKQLYMSCVESATCVRDIYTSYYAACTALQETGLDKYQARSTLSVEGFPIFCEESPYSSEHALSWDNKEVLFWEDGLCRLDRDEWEMQMRIMECESLDHQEEEYAFLRRWAL